jgi:hypothetical protein
MKNKQIDWHAFNNELQAYFDKLIRALSDNKIKRISESLEEQTDGNTFFWNWEKIHAE